MDAAARHAYGAHYTSQADILRIVNPTIVQPWQQILDTTSTLRDLTRLRQALRRFKVLDPACGSGNFLYVSYRELVRLEIRLLAKMYAEFSPKTLLKQIKFLSGISPHQ